MKSKTTTTLEFDELKDVFRIIELQRDLVTHLHFLKEATQKRVDEMKDILGIAQSLNIALTRYRTKEVKDLLGKDITDEEKRSLNSIFKQKQIHLQFPVSKKNIHTIRE